MQAASRAMNLRKENFPAPQAPDVQVSTLDYIFTLEPQPGPTLAHEITSFTPPPEVEELPDLEIARLMLVKPAEGHKKAPYAYQKNGQVQAEYRHILIRHMDESSLLKRKSTRFLLVDLTSLHSQMNRSPTTRVCVF